MRLLATILAAVGVLALLTTGAGAQAPTGTVTGTVYYTDAPDERINGGLALVPADVPQPISIADMPQYLVDLDSKGRFLFDDVAAGDYLLVLFRMVNPNRVPFLDRELLILEQGVLLSNPATLVSLSAGETVVYDMPIQPIPESDRPSPTDSNLAEVSVIGRMDIRGPVNPQPHDEAPEGPFSVYWVSTLVEQLVFLADNRILVQPGEDFMIRGVEDGEYFIIPPLTYRVEAIGMETLPYHVITDRVGFVGPEHAADVLELLAKVYPNRELPGPEAIVEDGFIIDVPVFRVTVAAGQPPARIAFTIVYESSPLASDGPLLPDTGTGARGGGGINFQLGSLLAVLTGVAAAGIFVALRVRREAP